MTLRSLAETCRNCLLGYKSSRLSGCGLCLTGMKAFGPLNRPQSPRSAFRLLGRQSSGDPAKQRQLGYCHAISLMKLCRPGGSVFAFPSAPVQLCGVIKGCGSCRFSPIFLIREIKVVGFTPKSSAAPSAPLIFQSVF